MDPTLLTTAKGDMTTAYDYCRDLTPVPTGPNLNPGSPPGNLGGLNLAPGLYKITGTTYINTNVTLTGGPSDVWIFQCGADLQVASGAQVTLAGGAQAKNIFWQVTTSAVLGTTSVFQGTILAGQSITMNTGSTMTGRALAFTGQVAYSVGVTGGGSLPADTAAVAINDAYSTPVNTPLNVAAPGVLINDTDVAGNPITAVLTGAGPAHGALTLNADGSFIYAPALGYHGSDSFTYEAYDGQLYSNVATVTLVVDAAPVAVPDVYTAVENTPLTLAAPGVLANDTDADGDTLTAVLVSGPTHGTLTTPLAADGSFTYTPTTGYTGSDSFIYEANDGYLNSNVATVTLKVSATVPAAPVAIADAYAVVENVTLIVPASSGVLANDTDAAGDTLTAVLVLGPTHGTLTLNANGSFSYAPTAGFTGSDSFTYNAYDASAALSSVTPATVTLTVSASNDTTPPAISGQIPAVGASQVPRNTLFALTISDAGAGVDYRSVTIALGVKDATGTLAYSVIYDGSAEVAGGTAAAGMFDSSLLATTQAITGHCYRVALSPASPGAAYRFLFALSAEDELDYQQPVAVRIDAADLVGNAMTTANYSFTTVMRSPGVNVKANSDSANRTHNHAKAAAGPGGNGWIVWDQTTGAGDTDVYISELTKDGHNCGPENPVAVHAGNQQNPVIAVDPIGTLWVAWEDNRNGNYDIFISSSTDGVTWTSPVQVNPRRALDVKDRMQPAIAIDSTGQVYVAWTEMLSGIADNIFVASSGATFPNATQVNSASTTTPTNPSIAIKANGVVYIVWQDMRTDTSKIYGATSKVGWGTDFAVVTTTGSQTSPVLAAEATGNVMHLLWVGPNVTYPTSSPSGNPDIFYATGTPSSVPLTTFVSITDDTTGAAHTAPAIAVFGSGDSVTVFACWQDARNGSNDIYFAATTLGTGFQTNIPVSYNYNDSTSAGQSLPAIVALSSNEAHMAWTDMRHNNNGDIYEAGLMRPEAWTQAEGGAEALIIALDGGTISVDNVPLVDSAADVMVSIPIGAMPGGMPVTIQKVIDPTNAPANAVGSAYEFGPSGLTFSAPVTVTLPYAGNKPAAGVLTYDPGTSEWSSDGITHIRPIVISVTGQPDINALQFETTHFSTFIAAAAPASGGGSGGCAMSRHGESDLGVLLLPCAAVGLWAALRIRRARRVAGR